MKARVVGESAIKARERLGLWRLPGAFQNLVSCRTERDVIDLVSSDHRHRIQV
jgi:hypothetical protein